MLCILEFRLFACLLTCTQCKIEKYVYFHISRCSPVVRKSFFFFFFIIYVES